MKEKPYLCVEMEKHELITRMESHGIKPTPNRILVAEALLRQERPRTLAELESDIESVDRSNIFRALNLFREHHFIHVIEDGCEGARYELCLSAHADRDEDMHVHFHCERCHRTFCLENIPVPPVGLPEGFTMETVNYLVKGICPECARHPY